MLEIEAHKDSFGGCLQRIPPEALEIGGTWFARGQVLVAFSGLLLALLLGTLLPGGATVEPGAGLGLQTIAELPPEVRPLRETIAATSVEVWQEVGGAMAMPEAPDSQEELLRGLVAVDRSVRLQHIERIVARAGLSLGPAAAWLLVRLGEQPQTAIEALGRYSPFGPGARPRELAIRLIPLSALNGPEGSRWIVADRAADATSQGRDDVTCEDRSG